MCSCTILDTQNQKELASRVASNASWATSMDKTIEMVSNLKSAGFVEINYSAGDNHQKYVPIDNIYNAYEAAIKEDILTVVNIETSAYHQFLPSHFENHPRYKELRKEDQKDLFSYVTSPWISVGSPEEAGSSNNRCPFGGDDIYDSIAVDPHGNVHACCGLVIQYQR